MTSTSPDGIIDTNVVILLPRLADDSNLPERPTITTITLAELSVGPLVTDDPIERANRQLHLQQAEADFTPLAFDQAAARAFGRVSADLRRAGRTRSARAYDALISAIAISNGLPLHTANPDDYSGITGLEMITVTVPPPA